MSHHYNQDQQHQEIRRRPFSVSEAYNRQQQCQEFKISNTTFITTCSSSQEAAEITTTTYRNTDNRSVINTSTHPSHSGYTTTSSHHQKHHECTSSSRSRSAFSSSKKNKGGDNCHNCHCHHCHCCPPPNISTNTSITLPIKRKIKFVYGGNTSGSDTDSPSAAQSPNQQNIDPNHLQPQQQTTTPVSPSKQQIEVRRVANDPNEDDSCFPYVRHSVHTKLPCSTITNSVEINKAGGRYDEEYDNYQIVQRSGPEHSSTAKSPVRTTVVKNENNENIPMDIGHMRIKDVEVEYEIDEDPAIFEGSEGYVKNLISKIQSQYKNPETVHIKITRRQKPEHLDKLGQLPSSTSHDNYGQIVRKEYYTVKTVPRAKKSQSISSFIDQANIPYIDEESGAESRTNSMRSIRHYHIDTNIEAPDRQKCMNYVIEQHIIYNDECKGGEKRKIDHECHEPEMNSKIKELLEHLGGSIRLEDLNKIKFEEDKLPKGGKQRFEIEAPSLPQLDVDIKGGGKAKLKPVKGDIEIEVGPPELGVDLDAPEVRGGIKSFLKGIGGKIKAPEVEVPDLNVQKPDIDVTLPSVDLDIKGPKVKPPKVDVDVDIKGPKIKTPKKPKVPSVDIDVQPPDLQAPELEILGGPDVKLFLKGLGGKIKAPDIQVPEVHIEKPDLSIPKVDVDIKGPKIKTPKVDIDITKPDLDLHGPDIDLEAPDLKGGIKDFFKGIGGKIKAPEVDIHGPRFEGPDLDVKLPTLDADLSLPTVDVDLKGPKIKPPKIDVDIKGPKIKTPKIEAPKVDIDLSGPDVDFKVPQISGDIDLEAPDVKGGIKGFFKGKNYSK